MIPEDPFLVLHAGLGKAAYPADYIELVSSVEVGTIGMDVSISHGRRKNTKNRIRQVDMQHSLRWESNPGRSMWHRRSSALPFSQIYQMRRGRC